MPALDAADAHRRPAGSDRGRSPRRLRLGGHRRAAGGSGYGPEASHATATWSCAAFSELAWQFHDVVRAGDVVVVYATMSGRQDGVFVAYGPNGRAVTAFPPRGRRFEVAQTHWFRTSDGKVIEHWANRDDLALGRQLGWTHPTPVHLIRMARALRRARGGTGRTRP